MVNSDELFTRAVKVSEGQTSKTDAIQGLDSQEIKYFEDILLQLKSTKYLIRSLILSDTLKKYNNLTNFIQETVKSANKYNEAFTPVKKIYPLSKMEKILTDVDKYENVLKSRKQQVEFYIYADRTKEFIDSHTTEKIIINPKVDKFSREFSKTYNVNEDWLNKQLETQKELEKEKHVALTCWIIAYIGDVLNSISDAIQGLL